MQTYNLITVYLYKIPSSTADKIEDVPINKYKIIIKLYSYRMSKSVSNYPQICLKTLNIHKLVKNCTISINGKQKRNQP